MCSPCDMSTLLIKREQLANLSVRTGVCAAHGALAPFQFSPKLKTPSNEEMGVSGVFLSG